MCLTCQALMAGDAARPITGFAITSWTTRNGGPGVVHDLAQTSDGTLWIASDTGLFRFDGIHFVHVASPPGLRLSVDSANTLFAPRSGGLWIGVTGLMFMKDGAIAEYVPGNELPDGTVRTIAEDADGAIWAGTSLGLARFANGRWQTVGSDWSLPPGTIEQLLVDHRGTLWVRVASRLLYLSRGSSRFVDAGEPFEYYPSGAMIAESPDGTLWIGNQNGGVRPFDATADAPRWVPGVTNTFGLTFDRDGALWSITRVGLQRLRNASAVAKAGAPAEIERLSGDRLSSDNVNIVFEDREGNVWVGTQNGLNRLAPSSLNMVTPPGEFHFALVIARDGSPWWSRLGPANVSPAPIMRYADGKIVTQFEAEALSCAYRDEDGTLWFAGGQGIMQVAGEALRKVSQPASTRGEDVQAMIRDRDGRLWVSFLASGVFRLANGQWTANGDLAGLPSSPAWSMSVDGRGRLWFGYSKQRVALIAGDSVRMFGADDGLDIGGVAAIHVRGDNVWLGGNRGLARFDGTRFVRVRVKGDDPFRLVWGIVETAAGELWVASGAGIVRLDRGQVDEILRSAGFAATPHVYDYRDGLPGTVQSVRPSPALVEAGDGRLWFALSSGLGYIDPARLVRNTVPPSVTIWSLTAAGREYSPFRQHTRLPVNVPQLAIGYTAGSLTMPERVLFRYRLEGFDDTWQDVGNRREAVYTNLAPGTYRFRVIAANNDGVWSDKDASIAFTIPPAFYQQRWFQLACALALVAALALVYRLRVRQVARSVRARLEERLVERERIARELHDTLLQGLQGLMLRFQAVATRIKKG